MRRLAWGPLAVVALTVTGLHAQPARGPGRDDRRAGARAGRASRAGDVVAFRWVDGWDQVPVQVDERKQVDLGAVYNGGRAGLRDDGLRRPEHVHGRRRERERRRRRRGRVHGEGRRLAGARPTRPRPPGVVAGSGVKVKVHSALGERRRRLDLPVQAQRQPQPGGRRELRGLRLQPALGRVQDDLQAPGRPQPRGHDGHDAVLPDHFSDRWLNDRLRIKAGDASGVDILDRAKALLGPGNCGRSEDTFDDAEGAFIANRAGPVRAIRSYIGANSGPLTQREHIFYEQREDIRTFLRVHAIPGPWDFFDYSSAAIGMTYRNNLNTGGVTIDGKPDTPAAGALTWESVDGPRAGCRSSALPDDRHRRLRRAPRTTSTTARRARGAETQCTGDAQAIGESGPWINSTMPNTDPRTAAVQLAQLHAHALLRGARQGRTAPPARPRPAARSSSPCRASLGRSGRTSPTDPLQQLSSWRASTPCSRS